MIRTKKARVVRRQSEVAEKMERVRRLLANAGYETFRVSPKSRRTSFDILAVKVGTIFLEPYWLYPTRTGRVVVRPWRDRKGSSYDLYRDISKQSRHSLRLFRSSPMPRTSVWYDWLTRASRKEAELLKLLV